MDQNILDKIACALGIDKETQSILDIGSAHPPNCLCETCRRWWRHVGPETAEHPYGPFSIEEIEDGTDEGNECRKARRNMVRMSESEYDE